MARVKSGSRYSANYYKIAQALTDTSSARSAAENQLVSINTKIKEGMTPAAAVQEILGVSLVKVQTDAKGLGSALNSFAKVLVQGLSKSAGTASTHISKQTQKTIDARRGIVRIPNAQGGDFITPPGSSNDYQMQTSGSSKMPLIIGGVAVLGLLGYALTMKPKKGKR